MGSHAHAKAHVHLCHAALQLCVVDFEEESILARDHFNHFLLYLRQLLGEVEIRGWALMLWCFSPPSDSTKQGGNPHVVPPSLPSANLSSAVWCGNAEIESLINILLFMVYGWRIYTLWYGPKTPLWCRSKIFFFFFCSCAPGKLSRTNTNRVISRCTFGFYQKLQVKWISYTLFGSHHLALA